MIRSIDSMQDESIRKGVMDNLIRYLHGDSVWQVYHLGKIIETILTFIQLFSRMARIICENARYSLASSRFMG